MKTQRNNSILLIGLLLAAGLWFANRHQPSVVKEGSDEASLAAVCEAMAWNIENDTEHIKNTSDIGEIFNAIGQRSAFGKSLKQQHADWFRQTGLRVKRALNETDESQALTPELRTRTAALFRELARELRGE